MDLTRFVHCALQCRCKSLSVPLSNRDIQQQLRGHISLVPCLISVFLPKCPVCFMAWFGILGSAGSDTWLHSIWGRQLTVALLGVTIGLIGIRAHRTRNVRPLLLATMGVCAIFYFKFVFELPYVQYSGLALLGCASIWSNSIVDKSVPGSFDAIHVGLHTNCRGRL